MNARELQNLFGEWRQLTKAEHAAIAADDWTLVHQHQDRKNELRGRIALATEAWKKQWPQTGESSAEYERQCRPLVAELISLETNNARLLAERHATVERQLTDLNRASGNLRGLNRAYGLATHAQWTSYS